MNKRERKEMASDVEDRLDDLDFDLSYEICDFHLDGTSIVEVDIDIDDSDDWPDDWDQQVEDILSDVAFDWGGWYSWDGWTISVSVSDND